MVDELNDFRKKWKVEIKQNTNKPKHREDRLALPCQRQRTEQAKCNKIITCQSCLIPNIFSGKMGISSFNQIAHNQVVSNKCNSLKRDIKTRNDDDLASYYPFRILCTLLSDANKNENENFNKYSTPTDCSMAYNKRDRKRTYFDMSSYNVEIDNFSKCTNCLTPESEQCVKSKGHVDIFISDLNEINDIPFFDIDLPRELALLIFQYLGVCDLCHCAQVSKSWKSLSEDDFLWCRVRDYLCLQQHEYSTQNENWKDYVKNSIVDNKCMEDNWRCRIGKFYSLNCSMGGVICAASSYKSIIVAGYSNCIVKLWNTLSRETCIFQPSNTALIIDETAEEGTIRNEISHITACHRFTAAAYSHGFVDVWSNVDEGVDAIYTVTLRHARGRNCQISSVDLQEMDSSVYLSVSGGHCLDIHTVSSDGQGQLQSTVVSDYMVQKGYWLQPVELTGASDVGPVLVVEKVYAVSVFVFLQQVFGISFNQTELHKIADAPVTCSDARAETGEIVVGFNLNTGPEQFYKVNVYDLLSSKMKCSFIGHTAGVSCVNAADSPPHRLVTGCQDRKVRLYDTRMSQSAAMTLIGHYGVLNTVQMDDWKVVSGDEAGFVCVWDQRMARVMWETNNRHPVQYCRFTPRRLVFTHVPYVRHHHTMDDLYTGLHQRHRGSLQVYDFMADQLTRSVPEICLSAYDKLEGYNYNIELTVPYDQC